jgi:hypothetical protein
VTYLNSRVSDLIAEQIGSTEWVFDSRNDSKVCIKPIVGPDGKMYNGCRALHGKTFKQGMKKPPDGSHIGCRCSAIDLPPKPKTVLEPKPIMEFGKFDPSEARDKNGEWTDGGAGGGSGGASSDTPAPNKNGGNLPKEKQKEIINSAKDAEFPAEKLLELRGENNKKLSTFLKDNIVKLPQSNPYYKKIYKEIHHRDMEDTDDFEVAEDDVRQKEKANIVDNISKVSGISKDKASAYVGQWAETSNDTNIDSINIQKAASEEFGIELSDWQKHQDIRAEKMAELRNPIVKNKFIKEYGNYADNFEKEYRDGVARLRNKNPKMGDLEARSAFEGSKEFKEINPLDKMPDSDYFDEKGFWDTPPSDYGGLYTRDYYASKLLNDVVGGKGTRDFKHDIETQTISSYIDTELAGTQEDYKKFLKGMYDNTQSQLEASGLKPDDEITIFRGTNENIPPGLLGAEGTIHGNALESWSLSPVVADRFGNHTISTQVKVKDILSTFTSGFGCMSECEVVILGGKPYQATIVREK